MLANFGCTPLHGQIEKHCPTELRMNLGSQQPQNRVTMNRRIISTKSCQTGPKWLSVRQLQVGSEKCIWVRRGKKFPNSINVKSQILHQLELQTDRLLINFATIDVVSEVWAFWEIGFVATFTYSCYLILKPTGTLQSNFSYAIGPCKFSPVRSPRSIWTWHRNLSSLIVSNLNHSCLRSALALVDDS